MRKIHSFFLSAALLALLTLIAPFGLAPAAQAAPGASPQIGFSVGVGGPGYGYAVQPVCSWGYYSYAPYGCAPQGYYGNNYFYNGIFLGVGPWSGWGYGHGWGAHRFDGNYRGGGRGYPGERGHVTSYNNGQDGVNYSHSGGYHGGQPRGGQMSHGGGEQMSHGGGGGSHGGGGGQR